MRLLLVHADELEYRVKERAVANADEDLPKEGKFGQCLVVFSAVEKGDDEATVRAAAEKVQEVMEEIHEERVVVYPFVHLTDSPADPATASKLLRELTGRLGASQVPFGWYKAFTLVCKGHPLAERSLRISGEAVPSALKKEEKLKSEFYVLTPDGVLHPASSYDFSNTPLLRKFYEYEVRKQRAYERDPPHIRLMREQELCDYEPGSDQGNLRYYPKGTLVKRLLEEAVTSLCVSLGAFEVETPVMYSFTHPALASYLNRFPARQYVVKSEGKDFFLRFAACFGQFLMAADSTISYRNLPLKLYELTRYSFRREQSGELCGLKRLRAFTMPDMHTLVPDLPSAKVEFRKQFTACAEWLRDLGLLNSCELAFRAVKDFFEENRDWYLEMVKEIGRPVLVELWPQRYAYFITKFEFNFIDNLDKASALSTVQLDVDNAENYGIYFIDAEGKKRHPVIVHASISGAVERNLYALLEEAARREAKGEKPSWPYWLAPVQVRVIPVSEAFVEKALELARRLPARADVDDRDLSVAKRVREAEKEWVPLIIVFGEREAGGSLSVRMRDGEVKEMSEEELVEHLRKLQGERPFRPLNGPIRLSLRPKFVG